MESADSEISLLLDPVTCSICFDDDFKAEQMYNVALCNHRFCMECMKRYIEVSLLMGTIPTCPYYQCESKLTLRSCVHLLTPKLKLLWEQRTLEELVPLTERIYCPNPRCSALMSKTELSKSTKEENSMKCFKCGERFCISCKVPWHSNLSCADYKRVSTNPTSEDMMLTVLASEELWRQCERCKHMIELSEGCIKLTCRCGYSFCYTCGAEWKQGGCPHRKRIIRDCGICTFSLVVLVIIIFLCVHNS